MSRDSRGCTEWPTQRSNLFESHWSNQWLTSVTVTARTKISLRWPYSYFQWVSDLFSSEWKPRSRRFAPCRATCVDYRPGCGVVADDSLGIDLRSKPPTCREALVSLGAERLFRLKGQNGAIAFAERLPHGSLLITARKLRETLSTRSRKSQTLVTHSLA